MKKNENFAVETTMAEAFVVEKSEPKVVEAAIEEASAEVRMPTISKIEYLETLVTYLGDPYQVFAVKSTGKGKCYLCGVETSLSERKICPTCLKAYKAKLQENYLKARETGADLIG